MDIGLFVALGIVLLVISQFVLLFAVGWLGARCGKWLHTKAKWLPWAAAGVILAVCIEMLSLRTASIPIGHFGGAPFTYFNPAQMTVVFGLAFGLGLLVQPGKQDEDPRD